MRMILSEYGSLMVAIVGLSILFVFGVAFISYYSGFADEVISAITGNTVSHNLDVTLEQVESMEV